MLEHIAEASRGSASSETRYVDALAAMRFNGRVEARSTTFIERE
jgi:hypothetical protein